MITLINIMKASIGGLLLILLFSVITFMASVLSQSADRVILLILAITISGFVVNYILRKWSRSKCYEVQQYINMWTNINTLFFAVALSGLFISRYGVVFIDFFGNHFTAVSIVYMVCAVFFVLNHGSKKA